MNDRADSFDLGESSVGVRTPAPGRGWGRVVAALLLVAVGGFVGLIDPLIENLLVEWTGWRVIFLKGGIGSAIGGVGYAIYDYRWPFGPRPGSGAKRSRDRAGRDGSADENY